MVVTAALLVVLFHRVQQLLVVLVEQVVQAAPVHLDDFALWLELDVLVYGADGLSSHVRRTDKVGGESADLASDGCAGAGAGWLWLQGRGGSLPYVGARCVRRRADAHHGLYFGGVQTN